MIKKVAALGLCVFSAIAVAEDDAKTSAWSGETELGFVKRTGNTDTKTLTAKQSILFDKKPWRNLIQIEASNSSTDDVRSGEKYRLTEQLDRFFTESSYGLVRATWERDRFSGFESQSTALLGYGFTLVDTKVVNLKFELGAGASRNEIEDCPLPAAECSGDIEYGEVVSSALYYISEGLQWKISEPAELGQTLSVEETDENTIARFDIFLKSQIMANVATKISYGLKYTDVVPEPLRNKDEEVTITLSYNF